MKEAENKLQQFIFTLQILSKKNNAEMLLQKKK
jgi:hypothetical protein